MSHLDHFGHLLEGVVEQDPLTDRYGVCVTDGHGQSQFVDVQALLEALKGQEVRLTLASLKNLAALAEMVESQGGESVFGITPDAIPGASFNIRRKS